MYVLACPCMAVSMHVNMQVCLVCRGTSVRRTVHIHARSRVCLGACTPNLPTNIVPTNIA